MGERRQEQASAYVRDALVPAAMGFLLPNEQLEPYLGGQGMQQYMGRLTELGRALNQLPERYARTSVDVDSDVRAAIAGLGPLLARLPDGQQHLTRLARLQDAASARAIGDAVEHHDTR